MAKAAAAAVQPHAVLLTPEGLAFFYPMYAIAPAAEGIPVFTVPYEAVGPYVPVSEAEPSSSAPQT
ncbi:MAG: RsiV family protein [Dysosmobacter sp.]